MKELESLISVITKNKVKQIKIIGGNTKDQSLLSTFYKKVAEQEFENEEDALEYFYGDKPNKQYYFTRLKSNLKERLLNTLFFIDINQPSFNVHQKAYYNCYKNSAAVKILIGRSAKLPAINLAEKTIKKAIKFEFTDIVLTLSQDLRMQFGPILGNRKKYTEYNELVQKYSKIQAAELKAEEFYSDLAINFTKSRATKVEVLDQATKYSTELRSLITKFNSHKLNFYAYSVIALKHQIDNDYEGILKVSDEALTYFHKKKQLPNKAANFAFLFKKLACYVSLKQYDLGEQTVNQCLKLIPNGSGNWYVTMVYYSILSFHSSKFQKAYDIYMEAFKNPGFRKQPDSIAELWKIQEAFVFYFMYISKIDPDKDSPVKKFRVSKFLNEVPTYSKDKRGTNVTLIILQILLLLQQKKYGVIIDRMESLKMYSHRYLRQDDTFRSNCFIKMLLCLPAASFHKKGVLRKADKYWKKLQSVPLEKANQSAEMEIVPYEMLWEFVLEGLDEKWH